MISGKIAATLQPSKFLLVILQVISTSVITKVKDQHIYEGIAMRFDKESDLYAQASAKIMFWCWLMYICLAVELLIIFSGKTLFNDKYNLIMVGIHIVGLFLTGTFLNYAIHYDYIFMLWLFSAAIPLGFEI